MRDPVRHSVEQYEARRVRDGASMSYARCSHPRCWWWASGPVEEVERATRRHLDGPGLSR